MSVWPFEKIGIHETDSGYSGYSGYAVLLGTVFLLAGGQVLV